VEVVRNWRPPDYPLRVRGIGEHLTHVPFSLRSLRTSHPDLAHAFHASDALASVAWARRTGRPSVLSWMGLMSAGWLSHRALRLETVTRAVHGSDALVVLSRTARDSVWRWMGVEGRIVYPGVDTRHFTPGGERDERPTIVCAAAPEVPAKRVGLLVRAFARVRRERPAARLVLMRPRDPALARELEGDGVELSDATSEEVVHLYRRAWVSALPSVNEAFGLVIAEALACGTPGVASTGFGPAEIIDRPQVGRLFAGEDEDALARALLEGLELAHDPGTVAACVRRASEFDTGVATTAHEELYAELVGRHG
jgi:glycosyltransferase involved in cell wall biosynthesis